MRGGFSKFGETSVYDVSLKPFDETDEIKGKFSMNNPEDLNTTLSYGQIFADFNRAGTNGKLEWTSPNQTGTILLNNLLDESSSEYPQSKSLNVNYSGDKNGYLIITSFHASPDTGNVKLSTQPFFSQTPLEAVLERSGNDVTVLAEKF